MIKVIIGTSMSRETRMYPANTSIRNILEENNLDYATNQITLDGAPVNAQLDKTLEDHGIKEKCMIVTVAKTNNA